MHAKKYTLMFSYSTFRAMLDVCCGAIDQSHRLQAHCVYSVHVVICVITVDHYGSTLHDPQIIIRLQRFYTYLSHLQLLLPPSDKGWPAAGPRPRYETPCPGCLDSPGLRAWSVCTNQPTTINDFVLKPRGNQRPVMIYCHGGFWSTPVILQNLDSAWTNFFVPKCIII